MLAKSGSFARTGLPQAVSGNTFDAANQMTAFNGVGLSYDANGNLTSDGTNTYAWDARNQLAAINGGASSFAYDALGRRVAKSIGGNVAQMLYDGVNPVQELSGGGAPTANLLTGLRIDEYFMRGDATGAMSLLTDALGSTVALTDATGALATQYTYEPFGKTTVGGPANANPFQFTSRENDGTGLYYYRARYYHPALQRFISEDPLGFEGGDVNLYGYVANRPTNLRDRTGLNPVVIFLTGTTLAGAAGGFVEGALTAPPNASLGEVALAGATGALKGAGAGLAAGLVTLAVGPEAAAGAAGEASSVLLETVAEGAAGLGGTGTEIFADVAFDTVSPLEGEGIGIFGHSDLVPFPNLLSGIAGGFAGASVDQGLYGPTTPLATPPGPRCAQ